MRAGFLSALVAAAAIAAPPAAEARGLGAFGDSSSFHKLQDIVVPPEAADKVPKAWMEGAELDSHIVLHWIGAGVGLEDKGYVIRVSGHDGHWRMNSRQLKRLQDLKVLPDPLPKYEVPLLDFAMGYSLWIIVAGLALWYGGAALLRGKKKAASI